MLAVLIGLGLLAGAVVGYVAYRVCTDPNDQSERDYETYTILIVNNRHPERHNGRHR